LKDNKDPLSDLYNIENTQKILNDEEISLINNIFNEVEEFYQITDIFENALSNNQLNHQQLNKIFKAITKIAYYKTSLKANKQPKKNLVRTFFELPEIISKKIRFFLYLTSI
jgi:hypothetical protein